jgi:hypothetical protein
VSPQSCYVIAGLCPGPSVFPFEMTRHRLSLTRSRAVPEQTKMRRSKLKCSTEQSSICASLSAFCALVPRSLSLFHRVPSCSIMEGHVPCWCRYLSRVSARPSVVASATTHPSCLSRTDELRHALDRQTMTLSALSAKLSVSYSSLVEMWAQIHSSSRLNR